VDFEVDVAFAFLVIEDFAVEVVLALDVVGNLIILDAYVLVPANGSVQV
jgi:hypothetical protein